MNMQDCFYLCPTCFEAYETMPFTHKHAMVEVNSALLGDDLRRPPVDADGHIQSRAPRWFLEIVSGHQHQMVSR